VRKAGETMAVARRTIAAPGQATTRSHANATARSRYVTGRVGRVRGGVTHARRHRTAWREGAPRNRGRQSAKVMGKRAAGKEWGGRARSREASPAGVVRRRWRNGDGGAFNGSRVGR